MKLPPADDTAKFMELKFQPGTWETRGIPEQGCRIRLATLDRVLGRGGRYEILDLIHGLMDWLDVTDNPGPAMGILRQLLDRHYPPDGRSEGRCHFAEDVGPDQIFHVAADMDRDQHVVAWQRRHWLIALAGRSEESGRMVVAAPAPISLSVADSIFGHAITSFMGEPFDSFEGLRASSRRTGSYYQWKAGAATLVDWDYGLGLKLQDGRLERDSELVHPPAGGWLAPNHLAMQVAIAKGFAALVQPSEQLDSRAHHPVDHEP